MSIDLWQQLAERDVPPPPPQFDLQVRQRLNKALLAVHLFDLLVNGALFAMSHFALAVMHLAALTVSGRPDAALPRRNENR